MKAIYAFGICTLITVVSCKKKPVTLQVERNDITESVYASGRVKAVEQYNVYATVNAVLIDIPVSVGDLVVKGQTLLTLDNITSELNSENARLMLELSADNNSKGSDKLQEAELGVKAAGEKMLLDSTLYMRQKKLWGQNIGTELELKQKQLSYDNSLISYKTAKARMAQLRTQLRNDLKRAGISYDVSKKQAADFEVKSAMHGKVYDILKEKGELVTPQTPLAVVGMADSFVLELQVDENDILSVLAGQKVLVTMDSYKGQALEAVVTKVYPIMNERTRTFTVEASFINRPVSLYPNLTVEANIIIQTRKNSITIPNNYIIDGKYVLTDKETKREVKIGLKDYQKSEILEGLKEKEIIFKP